ncbi:MAG TPA: metallophosphoesterase, partial [Sphingobacteriaceae bacterium]|nr:metallophosphoesterase [Sphingobacteriaceae bacterium]
LYDGSKYSAPYIKSSKNNQGTVYVVSGSAGQLGGHTLTYPHDAMYYSNYEVGGSVMLEVQGNKLDLKWICSDGQIRDHFTMMKDVTPAQEKMLAQDKQLTK